MAAVDGGEYAIDYCEASIPEEGRQEVGMDLHWGMGSLGDGGLTALG